ncbi:Protein HIRA [Coccomyxa sp. Obi]|nr:Protein HIRA [Coccomyxa sp. Obi]
MLVDKPDWVEHGGSPIFSIDVHPAGSRFVTAGSDHKAKVWNLLPVLEVLQEQDEQCPRLLATLTDHYGPVNVARFSKSGSLLATGSDDKLTCLYELRAGTGQSTFGSNDGPNVENWKLIVMLRGHSNNVTDLAWSKDDTYLASCSLDNTIIIWNPKNGQQITTLQGHESYVKGVAWDPIGKYLASQSDDRTVRLWRADDWAPVVTVSEPFQKGWVSNTFSLRLGWSPDGQHLAAVNSYQSPCHTAALLDRRTWKYDFSFVGHNGAIVKASFNPMFLKPDENSDEAATCIALGSQDTKLSVWLSNAKRPTFVGHKLFQQSVLDLAWTPDGYSLLACSSDGTVAILQFEAKELGVPLKQGEVDDLLKGIYGSSGSKQTLFVESAAQLRLEAAAANGHAAAPSTRPAPLTGHHPSAGLAARMQPAGGVPSGVGPSAAFEPRTANGQQRRLAPTPLQQPMGNGSTGTRIAPQPVMAGPVPPTASQRGQPSQPQPSAAPRKPAQTTTPAPAAAGSKRKAPEGAAPPSKRLVAERLDARPPTSQAAAVSPAMAARPLLSLSTPEATVSQQLHAGGSDQSRLAPVGQISGRVLLEAANDLARGLDAATAELMCSCNGKQIWTDRIGGCVARLAGSQNYAAVGLRDGSVQVYSPAGRRLLPAMQLGSAPVFLVSDSGWRLLAVTQLGSLLLWDLKEQRLVAESSIEPLLRSGPSHLTVVSVRLSGAGLPLVVLSNSTAFALHLGMKTWMRVADSNFSFSSYMSIFSGSAASAGDLSQVQGQAMAVSSSPGAAGVSALAADHARTAELDRAHLEANMAAALLLESQQEYRRWLLTYVRHLAGDADEGRLRELCEGLLGPVRCRGEAGDQGDAPRTLGLDTRKLLRDDVLREVSRNRMHQRLVSEFQELVNEAM